MTKAPAWQAFPAILTIESLAFPRLPRVVAQMFVGAVDQRV
jgi:hypothetical protein